jgi:hypothetical protein
MAATQSLRPERTTIRGGLEIPRMINGLWQLAGGHNKELDVPQAVANMGKL